MIRRLLSIFVDVTSCKTPSEFFQSNTPHTKCTRFGSDPRLDNLSFLHKLAPCFPVRADCVRIINEPDKFYQTVLKKLRNAKVRVSLVSLYLGIGKLEHDLIDAIQENVKNNDELKVDILLDYNRGTRGKKNSKAMLMPLVKNHRNVTLSLYHTPLLRGIAKRLAPARWNELLGLQHMKLYLFDDTIILSGANLSNDYFTNRQDRYIEIEDRHLANFFSGLIGKVQEFSMIVNNNGHLHLHHDWKLMPYESDHSVFAAEARKRIEEFFTDAFDEQQKNLSLSDMSADTWIFPTLEMGQLNIHHDSLATLKILSSAQKGSMLKMATGYFNLTQSYMDAIVNDCNAKCSIIMAHPNANGFQGAKGISGGIPAAYTQLAKKFYEQIQQHHQEDRISLLEYERDSWSYHAKGIWYYPQESKQPFMTVVGSSNYGERSVNRDLEAQICLVTTNTSLQRSLQAEYEHLFNFATTAENQLISRFVPKWVQTVVFLFKNFF